MDCSQCPAYKDTQGHGGKACLRCKRYKDFCRGSGNRQTIKYEVIPQAILEQVEDITQRVNVLEMLRSLPLDLSTPLMMRYILGATNREIADYYGQRSRNFVQRKINLALEIIKKSPKISQKV